MSKVYIVIGSQDGIMGVYSSKKKARVVATNYVLADSDFAAIHCKEVVVYATKWNERFSSTTTENRAEIKIEDLL